MARQSAISRSMIADSAAAIKLASDAKKAAKKAAEADAKKTDAKAVVVKTTSVTPLTAVSWVSRVT